MAVVGSFVLLASGVALLLTVERDEIYHRQIHVLDGNTASLRIPVRDIFRPNAYVTATLIRGADELEPGDIALLVMGGADRAGKGCACPENVLLRSQLDTRRAALGVTPNEALNLLIQRGARLPVTARGCGPVRCDPGCGPVRPPASRSERAPATRSSATPP